MKRNDINDIREKIFFQEYGNLFNVYLTDKGNYFYNILKKLNVPDDIDSSYINKYTTQHGDTWPLIAYNIYGDVKLWWIICIINKIENPLLHPEAGISIKLLTTASAQNILMSIKGD